MLRQNYAWQKFTDFRGGINRDIETARPNQVEDARDVWVRDGLLQSRPGSRIVSLASFGATAAYSPTASIVKEDGGVFSTSASWGGLALGDYGYIGWDSSLDRTEFLGFSLTTSDLIGQKADVGAQLEYWNGKHWKSVSYFERRLAADLYLEEFFLYGSGELAEIASVSSTDPMEITLASPDDSVRFFGGTPIEARSSLLAKRSTPSFAIVSSVGEFGKLIIAYDNSGGTTDWQSGDGLVLDTNSTDQGSVYVVAPEDWALTTVNSLERYWFRFRIIPREDNSLDTISVSSPQHLTTSNNPRSINGLVRVQWSSSERFIISSFFEPGEFFPGTRNFRIEARKNLLGEPFIDSEFYSGITETFTPLSVATVLELDRSFACCAHRVYEVNKDGIAPAVARTDIVSSTEVIDGFPRANQLVYHYGLLFAFDILDEPTSFRYSGPVLNGDYNVWFVNAVEALAEVDNSPIIGGYSWDEQLIVAKGDSLWRIVPDGTIPNEGGISFVPRFRTKLIQRNVGWVSRDAVAATPVGLFFAYEDGFYMFDGVRAQKVSGDIDEIYSQINPARRSQMTAVYWPAEQVVMCAAPLRGSKDNNVVFVYEYSTGSWWVWNLDVQSWLTSETSSDDAQMLFGDAKGRIWELNPNFTEDNGAAIEGWVRTHRFPPEGTGTNMLAAIDVISRSESEDIKVTPIIQGVPQDELSLVFTDPADAQDGAADGVREWPVRLAPALVDYGHSGRWVQMEFRSTSKRSMKLYGFSLGFIQQGVR